MSTAVGGILGIDNILFVLMGEGRKERMDGWNE